MSELWYIRDLRQNRNMPVFSIRSKSQPIYQYDEITSKKKHPTFLIQGLWSVMEELSETMNSL